MRLQFRFLIVFATIFVVTASYLLIQQRFEVDRSSSVLSNELDQRKSYMQNIITLDGNSEKTLAEDYSFWDQMVSFIQQDNIVFAHQNLDTALSTFNAYADWVFRPNGTQIYFSSADGTNSLNKISLPPKFFAQLSVKKFEHFYIKDNNQVVEIRAATVVPSSDPNHLTPEQGFLLFGRIIGPQYIRNISKLSNSDIQLEYINNTHKSITNDSVTFVEPLKSWNGLELAYLRSTSLVTIVSDLKQQYHRQLELLGIFSLVSVTFLVTMLWWLVLLPVNEVINAIKQQKPEIIKKLQTKHTEFGQLAQTVTEFFQQRIRLAEAEFKRTELEKLNKEKTSFLAIAAHELNGPVNNVKLFADYLTFLLSKDSSEVDIDKQVKHIESQTRKINMLLNDLRAASMGNHDLEFHLEDVDFDKCIKDAVDEASYSVKIKLNIITDTHAIVNSDPDRLGEVISNLITNAVKYSNNSGEILIAGKLKDNNVVFSIRDFGLGIAQEDLPHLFERFYRSSRVSAMIPGFGLGLSISKNIIERLGGSMWVESKLGEGSTFYFSIPVKSYKDHKPLTS